MGRVDNNGNFVLSHSRILLADINRPRILRSVKHKDAVRVT